MEGRPPLLLGGLLVMLAGSLALSLFTLSHQSIRLDEAQSLWVATKPVHALMRWIAEDVHVPLYPLLLHLWVQVFGTDILVARIPSFLFFLGTLPVLYLLGKEASTKRVAFLSLTFFALSPFMLWFSSEARMYTLFTLVTSLNHLYFLRWVRSRGRRGRLGVLLTTVCGLFTHYFFAFVVVSQGVYLAGKGVARVVRAGRHGTSLPALLREHAPFLRAILGIFLAASVSFLPWVLYVYRLGSASRTQPLIPPPTHDSVIQVFVHFLFGFQGNALQAIIVSLWPLSAIVLFLIFTQRRRIPAQNIEYFVIATFLPITLVFLMSYIRPMFLSRYLIFVIPTLFFLIAWFLLNQSRRLSSLLTAGVLMGMAGLLVYQDSSAITPVKENYSGVAAFLTETVTARDIIAVSAPFTVYPLEYAYVGPARLSTIPEWNRYREGAIPDFSLERFQEQVTQYRAQYQRVFVVLSHNQGYEADIRRYLDTHFALEHAQEFSPGVSVRVYRLRYDLPAPLFGEAEIPRYHP
jgi:mannosyltransferase